MIKNVVFVCHCHIRSIIIVSASRRYIPRRRHRKPCGSTGVQVNMVSPSPPFETVSYQNDIRWLQWKAFIPLFVPIVVSPSPPQASEYLVGISRHNVAILAQINCASSVTICTSCVRMARPRCQCRCRCMHRPAKGNRWQCQQCSKLCCQSCIGWRGNLCHQCMQGSYSPPPRPHPPQADEPELEPPAEDS